MATPLSHYSPDRYREMPVRDLLYGVAMGWADPSRELIEAILAQDNASQAALEFSREPRDEHRIDTDNLLIALFRHWKTPAALDFYLDTLRRSADDVADELVEALLPFGKSAIDPLVKLYEELGEETAGDIAFVLAGLKLRDDRILNLLIERMEFDAADGAFLLGLYGDPAAKPALEKMLAEIPAEDKELVREFQFAIEMVGEPQQPYEIEPFDVFSQVGAAQGPDFDVIPPEEALQFFDSADGAIRAAAVYSFFNEDLEPAVVTRIRDMAKSDPDPRVRGRAWETLAGETKDDTLVESMAEVLTDRTRTAEERGGAAIGLYMVADEEGVHELIEELYEEGGVARAKALEAMWRSLWKPFAKYFQHLDDADQEIVRHSMRGVGVFGLKEYCDKLEGFFENDDLREDALFAYAMAMPGETSRGRVKGMLRKIDALAELSPDETQTVMFALDERLRIKGLKPVFEGEDYSM